MTHQKQVAHPPEKFFSGSFHEFAASPPEFLSRLANQYGGVVNFRLFYFNAYLIAEPEIIREVLVTRVSEFPKDSRDTGILSKFLGAGLVTVGGAEHTRQRKMAQPAFHARRIGAYGKVMTAYAAALAQDWPADTVRDMCDEMEKLTMYVVTKTLFDVDKRSLTGRSDQIGEAIHALQALSNEAFQQMVPIPDWLPTSHNRRFKYYREVLDQTVHELIAARRSAGANDSAGRDDLLSIFLDARYEDGSPLTDLEIRDQLVTLFVAGHETTSNALAWTWYLLAQHPAVEARLHQELAEVLNGRLPTVDDLPHLPYSAMILKESLRIFPPVWGLSARQVLAATDIGGYPVKKGSLLFISPYAMHRNPRFFPEPDRFDPERFTPENEAALPRYAYMPFGGGPRICIGNAFAMMEAQLILVTLAGRYRFELEPGQTIEPLPLVTLSPRHGLKMRAVPR